MTPEPRALAPDDTAAEAPGRMHAGRCCHLPVVGQRRIAGGVTIRDQHEALRSALDEGLHSDGCRAGPPAGRA